MLDITIQLDILARLIPQVTTIIYHHMKKVLLKKKKIQRKRKNYTKTHMLTKIYIYKLYLFIKNSNHKLNFFITSFSLRKTRHKIKAN